MRRRNKERKTVPARTEVPETWDMFDDDDMSTECLMAMTCDAMDMDPDDVVEALVLEDEG